MATESVWDYPRPPAVEPVDVELTVTHGGVAVARTTDGLRVLETSHPPTYYFPPSDVAEELLVPNDRRSVCEYKGVAHYFDVAGVADAAWSYPAPSPGYEALAGRIAFYASKLDECSVGGEVVAAQPGDFYGGWLTAGIEGPVKGGPGTAGW